MQQPTLLVINGHPNGHLSLCGALANACLEGAREAGHQANALILSELDFCAKLQGLWRTYACRARICLRPRIACVPPPPGVRLPQLVGSHAGPA